MKEFPEKPAFMVPALLESMVAEGKMGRKSGKGFYSWNEQRPAAPAAAAPHDATVIKFECIFTNEITNTCSALLHCPLPLGYQGVPLGSLACCTGAGAPLPLCMPPLVK